MTSNFDFVPWDEIRTEAHLAEAYGKSDPVSCLVRARRAIELTVRHVYDMERLAQPYRATLAAQIKDDAFRQCVPGYIITKLDLIRDLGNAGAHVGKRTDERKALIALGQLYDVMRWAAYEYSATPDVAPIDTPFNESLIGAAQPLTNAELNALLEKFETHDREIAARDEANARLEEELERTRKLLAEAQQAKIERPIDLTYSEDQTRTQYIDVDLEQAGWRADRIRREYPVTGMPNASGAGYVDYVLLGEDDRPVALIEAKRASRDPMVAQEQAKLYADALEQAHHQRPVIMWSNGIDHYLLDDAGWTHGAGYPAREIAQFLSPDAVDLIIRRRTNRADLNVTPINSAIAGREYQAHAIRQIDDVLMNNRRKALLVMATGTGKTRTVIALVDQLLKANWAKRVLFLADRVTLVQQAARNFREHLPNASVVNLIEERDADGFVFVSTYPTMMNTINDVRDGHRCFGPGFFDLIVVDEAHRSVYQKYTEIFRWFDGILIGLTATPKEEIDRNTYRLFNLEDGVPTDAYPFDEAVKDGYLVPYEAMDVPTRFMRQGIRYADLSEEQRAEWDSLEWGDEMPEDVDPEALNKWLFNRDTVRKVLATVMEQGIRVADGDRIGKTIIFARNNDHAEFIREVFADEYPHLGPNFARVITYRTEYAQSLIDDFSDKLKTPHIAISVDMLDTGIDVPEVVNLVMFKPIRSYAKFWQMLGRGTRLCEDLDGLGTKKSSFRVFDLCQNFEFIGKTGGTKSASLPVSLPERLFTTRAKIVHAIDEQGRSSREVREAAVTALRQGIGRMNPDNFIVRPHRETVERFSADEVWDKLSAADVEGLATLAKLPGTSDGDELGAKQFDLWTLTAQLAVLEGDEATLLRMHERIQTIAAALLDIKHIPAVAPQEGLLRDLESDEWWQDVTPEMIEQVRKRLRSLVSLIEPVKRPKIVTDFEDEIGPIASVQAGSSTGGMDYDRFKEKARSHLRAHEDDIVLQRLRRNKQLTADDLRHLEELLAQCAPGGDTYIERAREEADGLGVFIRSLVGMDRQAAKEAFGDFLADRTLSAAEIQFVNLIIEDLTTNGVVAASRLFQTPYSDIGTVGEMIFLGDKAQKIKLVLGNIRDTAIA